MKNELVLKIASPEVKLITTKDPQLGELISRLGDYQLSLRTDYFGSLAHSIIGQQLAVNAARTIWNRFALLCQGEVEPEVILGLDDESLRGAGLSRAKASYIKDLAVKVAEGTLILAELPQLSDEEVIKNLVQVKGIGTWTAEMFLIFSLGRMDVFSEQDFGLRRSAKWLYKLPEMPAVSQLRQLQEKWIPYRTVASLYLWEAINTGLCK